jgi:hypothetical protein
LILAALTVVALAGPENVIEMGAVVDTEVASAAGDEAATENVPDGDVVTGAVLLLDEQPVISATKMDREAIENLQELGLYHMAISSPATLR